MVSAITSANQYPISYEAHEVMRRLQSLNVAPTGNLAVDRQHLQTAELLKRQTTMASNSQVNLNKLEGTGGDFASTINYLGSINKTDNIKEVNSFQEIGLKNNTQNSIPYASAHGDGVSQYNMAGAQQLAELNKLKLGLIA